MKAMNLRTVLVACLFSLSAACASSAQVDAPDGFAELEETEDYGYRATSAEGVVIGVRTESNDPHGNLSFWTSAIDHKLRKSGYTPMLEAPIAVESEHGLAGKRLRYKSAQSGRPHEYWVTVFVTDSKVILVEAAGDEAFFDAKVQKQIEAATKTVKT